jgi:hypothetical protein
MLNNLTYLRQLGLIPLLTIDKRHRSKEPGPVGDVAVDG